MKTPRIVKSSVATLAIQVGGLGVAYVLGALVARTLGPTGFGTYSYVFALVTLATMPASFGFPKLIVREVAGAAVSGNWGLVSGLVRRAHQFALASALLASILFWSVWSLAPDSFPGVSSDLLLWAILAIPLMAIAGIRTSILRGLSYVALGTFPDQVLLKLVTLGALVGVLWAGAAVSPSTVMSLHVLGVLAATISGYVLVGWLLPRKRTVEARFETKKWLRAVVPLGLSQNMNLLNGQLGLVVLGAFGRMEEVAHLRIANQISLLAVVVYGALNSVIYPRLCSAYKREDFTDMERVATAGARAATAAALGISVVFVLTGPWMVRILFGQQYDEAVEATRLMLLCQTINASFGFAASVLTAAEHEKVVTKCFLISTAANLLATPALGWYFGAAGAAGAAVLVTLVLNIPLASAARRHVGVRTRAIGRIG